MTTIALQTADQRQAMLFKALGHPARLEILRLLAQRKTCVCGEVVRELPLAQSTVSQHLKVLKDAGLVVGNVEGQSVCYCLAPGAVGLLRKALQGLTADLGKAD